MGWTGIYTKKSFMEVFKEEYMEALYNQKILKVCEFNVSDKEPECLEESEFYIACRRHNGTIGCNTIIFRRYDISKHRDKEEVVFKEMDEGMGPYINNCPIEILKMLSPVEQLEYPGYAKEFRERQRHYKTVQMYKLTM